MTDIAVVGAGPVGLLLAILLGRAGHAVTVLERWPEVYDRPRAVTMDHEVARILASLGIDCDADPAFENHRELYYWKDARRRDLQIVDWESLAPSGWHVTYWFNQPELERRLGAIAVDTPGVTLRRGQAVTGLAQDADGATLTTEDGGTLRAGFVVGADGANSFVRDALGLPVVDEGYFFDWLILDVVPRPGFRMTPAQWQLCDPARPTTLVPGGPGRRRWEFMLLDGEDPKAMEAPEAAWRLLEPWGLAPDRAELERSAVYRFQARWAERWVDGRCMIAGDAAHLMPPFAGEGMCAGLRDAVALAWRLSAILRGVSGPALLQSYESERLAHARHYIRFSRDLGEIICLTDPEAAAARDARMIADLEARGRAPISGDHVTLGPGAWRPAPGAGELSPQGVVRFAGREGRFDQVVGEGWLILALDAEAPALSPAQRAAFARLGGRVVCVGEGRDAVPLDAAYAGWAQATGARYLLQRPDFYVAAAAGTEAGFLAALDAVLDGLALTPEAAPA